MGGRPCTSHGSRWPFHRYFRDFLIRWWTPKDALAAGHRRKKGNLAGARDHRVGTHMAVIDGCADHLGILEGVSILLVALGEPRHQLADRRHSGRWVDLFFRLADALTHPRKIKKLHASSRVR